MPLPTHLPRRRFLQLAAAAATASTGPLAFAATPMNVTIVIDPKDPTAAAAPVSWAAEKLRKALGEKGAVATVVALESESPSGKQKGLTIFVVGAGSLPKGFKSVALGPNPESVRLAAGRVGGADALLIASPGVLGLVYGLTDLADRVECSVDAALGLRVGAETFEVPANEVRSAARSFCSEVEDKPWYGSKSFWVGYLDMLVASRFNRFNLAFGFGYDFPNGVTGDYFHYPYPYLVTVPGYDVRVVPLAAGEREHNLEMLQFIVEETARRGLQFQLGIWTHAYEWTASPNADHHIEGLTPANHAAYSRDALAMLLKLCPAISGVTLRVHGESGIPEGSYDFWRTLFQAIKGCGRTVEIDMHAKGINQIMIDMANDTGMPVKVGAKSWAEHMGLGYQQTDIRELEIPTPARMETGVFNVSNGERRFTRYGYADLLQNGRKYNVLFRLWPGTQHHLLWGDPKMAAAYSRTAHFCGAAGLEICEPLTFKGREGSGHAGGRNAYLDKTLEPVNDTDKFAYTFRLWGRMLYNPDTPAEVWQRSLMARFGGGAAAAETSMANASRVLPLITTAHLPSASNHSFWPELYTNMPIVPGVKNVYTDTPKPYRFGTVSPLDPQIFSSIDETVDSMMQGKVSAKYSPLTVAEWLERFVSVASTALSQLDQQSTHKSTPEYRRWKEDVLIQNGLGSFFAAKLRAGVAFEFFLRTGDAAAGRLALTKYTEARATWATMAQRAAGVYVADVSYGRPTYRRGHWMDRLPAIDDDLAAMRTAVAAATVGKPIPARALAKVAETPERPKIGATHNVPDRFVPGQELALTVTTASTTAELYYRHVNQGERWRSVAMTRQGGGYVGSIPAAYTRSEYALQYYFVLGNGTEMVYHPEFNATLSNQPYFDVWHRA